MKKTTFDEKLIIIGFIAAIVVGYFLFKAQAACDKEGGTLVKTAMGWVKCIHEK